LIDLYSEKSFLSLGVTILRKANADICPYRYTSERNWLIFGSADDGGSCARPVKMLKVTSKLNSQKNNSVRNVRNGTEWVSSQCHDKFMQQKKARRAPRDTTRASVKKEMAQPRMARSARIAERNLDTTRVPEQPSTTIPGTVDKIIPPRPSGPEKAQIAVDRADHRHRDLRIENSLTDENGDEVKLQKGAQVEVTVAAKSAKR